MKRNFLISVLCVIVMHANGLAQDKDGNKAVSMVSYEQGWLDGKGTIALKNNTSEDIYNVSFVLEYLDMQGNPMDYEVFSYDIDIAPGMTRKLDIPAYEHERQYHYYKTKDEFGHPAFKLHYELKSYNNPSIKNKLSSGSDSTQAKPSSDESRFRPYISFIMIFVLMLLFSIYVGLYVLVAVMAQKRHRNPVIWLLLSFIATPLLICIVLLAIGSERRNGFLT